MTHPALTRQDTKVDIATVPQAQFYPTTVETTGVVATDKRRRRWTLATAGVVVLFGLVLRTYPGREFQLRAFDDLAQLAAAAAAAACCSWRARHSRGRGGLSWWLLTCATAAWAVGEGCWSYYEVLLNKATPFPSLADVFYLLFPPFALAGLLVRPAAAFTGRGRLRMVLDGGLLAASLFTLSWSTSLGAVYRSGADSTVGLVTTVSYPVGDVVILTVALLILAGARARAGLITLSAGLMVMAVADSSFAYLVAAGSYRTGSLVDVVWVASFLIIGLAAVLDEGEGANNGGRSNSIGYLLLPYPLAIVGIAIPLVQAVRNDRDAVTRATGALIVGILLVRQLLMLLDNRALVLAVEAKQDELEHRAFHDSLTGLANRALFSDRVSHALEMQNRDLRCISLVFCDLDDFKSINEALGHAVGDSLLKAVAERLNASVRTGDTVARLGGDEFGILLEDDGDPNVLSARLLQAFMVPVQVADRQIPIRASLGVTVVNPVDAPITAQELIRRADLAMDQAKRGGKPVAVHYSPELPAMSPGDLDLRLALADDILHGRIRVAFQPIFDLAGRVYAYEALARWSHRDEPVSPGIFIPAAERANLLDELDMVVLAKAVERAVQLGPGLDGPLMSVNIALTHLPDPQLVQRIAAILRQHGLPPQRLIVEVPEDKAIDDPRAIRTLEALQSLGIPLALDDFGVGYSSLSRLSELRVDILKLDRSFVIPLAEPGAPTAVIAGIVELSHRLGARVVAEGVETRHQLDVLTELGCDAFQGFLLGRPTEQLPEPLPQPLPAQLLAALPTGLPIEQQWLPS